MGQRNDVCMHAHPRRHVLVWSATSKEKDRNRNEEYFTSSSPLTMHVFRFGIMEQHCWNDGSTNNLYRVMRNALRLEKTLCAREEDPRLCAFFTRLRKILHECIEVKDLRKRHVHVRAAYAWFLDTRHFSLPVEGQTDSRFSPRFPIIQHTLQQRKLHDEPLERPTIPPLEIPARISERTEWTKDQQECISLRRRRFAVEEMDRSARDIVKCERLGVRASKEQLERALFPFVT